MLRLFTSKWQPTLYRTIHARSGLLEISQSLGEILLGLQRMSDIVKQLCIVPVHSQARHEYTVLRPPDSATDTKIAAVNIIANSDDMLHHKGGRPPKNYPFPWEHLGPQSPHLIHGSLSPHPKRHLNQFSRFSTVHGCDRQRHGHTDSHTQTTQHR